MVFFVRNKSDRRELLASMASVDRVSSHKIHDNAAFQHVRDNMDEINYHVKAKETDIIFLKTLMNNPTVESLIKVQNSLEEYDTCVPEANNSKQTSIDLCHHCTSSKHPVAKDLLSIITKLHFKTLLEVHDKIALKRLKKTLDTFDLPPTPPSPPQQQNGTKMSTQTYKVIGLRKKPDEPLGLTVEQDENGNLIVARILAGGTIDKQGLLKKGDVILEVNGERVESPEDLLNEVSRSKDTLQFRIAPGFSQKNTIQTQQCYMRALFDYDPMEDTLIPCKEIGLTFKHGDILQVLDQKDPNWWQAKKVGDNELPGLIPSQELEERRKAFVAPEADYVHKTSICGTRISKKKCKKMYQSKWNGEFDKAELILYEEVTKMPPFKRRTLAIIGTTGVGRRTLKGRLINSDPQRFAGVIPYTTRPQRELEENGQNYWFTDREQMEHDIREHKFLEYGENGGNLYGTNLDSIRDVINQGKMCVLDCSPVALKMLHNSSEFMPYVIFIAAPGVEVMKSLYDYSRNLGYSTRTLTFDRQSSIRYSSRRARTLESLASIYEEDDVKKSLEESACLQRMYEKYIDLVIVNEDFDMTFRKVVEALEIISNEHQWVPVNWVY
ncbi:MAGUK p55 subfamily member 6 isoform X2 [Myzus persicae]|uniref:MAGUK p55 subfamily member 6 isoform X2 n=1 Tax=Myzus persicae TaxID=13164 RepID=UPI000B92FAC5|nr:MAGUK p55 subfamily member 6 isoform X2 [Myzus persicae]